MRPFVSFVKALLAMAVLAAIMPKAYGNEDKEPEDLFWQLMFLKPFVKPAIHYCSKVQCSYTLKAKLQATYYSSICWNDACATIVWVAMLYLGFVGLLARIAADVFSKFTGIHGPPIVVVFFCAIGWYFLEE